jgi:hypothetical protein
MSDFFQEAYRRARSRYTQEQWVALTPQQITDAIYREMRAMDAASQPDQPETVEPRRRRPSESSET